MRLSTYNIEWFEALFDESDHLRLDEAPSARHEVSRRAQAEAIADVLRAIDADGITIIEGPNTGKRQSTVRALTRFAEWADLRTRDVVMGFANDTRQEIAFLFDSNVMQAEHAPISSPRAPRFDATFEIDLDVDAKADMVRFSKPPMELMVTPADGMPFRLIGAHLKSKAPHGARSKDEAMLISIANRRKQLAQALFIRGRVDQVLDIGAEVIVLGDLNDSPGLDVYEELFARSSVEIIMGQSQGPEKQLFDPHAMQMIEKKG